MWTLKTLVKLRVFCGVLSALVGLRALFVSVISHASDHGCRIDFAGEGRKTCIWTHDDTDLIQRYRVTRPVLLEVIDLVDDDIAPYTRRSRAVPTSLQVCVALRFLATGTYQLGNGDMAFGLSQPTVSRIITRVTTALRKKKHSRLYPSLGHWLNRNENEKVFIQIADEYLMSLVV